MTTLKCSPVKYWDLHTVACCLTNMLQQKLVMQIISRPQRSRDWEQVVDDYISKAAAAHAPSRLLAMRNAVPNASSRMVYQSQALSLPSNLVPEAEPDPCTSDSEHDSGEHDTAERLSPIKQQAQDAADGQLLPQLPQNKVISVPSSDNRVIVIAALPATTEEGAIVQHDATAVASPAKISRVYNAVKHYEQLSAASQSASPSPETSPPPATAAHSAVPTKVALQPLQIPDMHSPDEEESVRSPSVASTAGSTRGGSGTATTPSRWHPPPSQRQGAAARNQAAIAAHQARLATLHTDKDTKGWIKPAGHAATPGRASAPTNLQPALRRHSSVAVTNGSSPQQSPRPLPPLRRFGSVTPSPAAAATPRHSQTVTFAERSPKEPPVVTIADILRRNSSMELPAADMPNPANRLPALDSTSLHRGASVAASPNRVQPPLRRGASVATPQRKSDLPAPERLLPLRRGSSVTAPPSRFSSGSASPQRSSMEAGSTASARRSSSVTDGDSWRERLAAISPKQSQQGSPSRSA